jgi:hypothetical protein
MSTSSFSNRSSSAGWLAGREVMVNERLDGEDRETGRCRGISDGNLGMSGEQLFGGSDDPLFCGMERFE